jgi:hypothetical protein
MIPTHDPLQDIKEIRALMERSSRFISLSGLSGVAAGICALVGAAAAYHYMDVKPFEYGNSYAYYFKAMETSKWGIDYQRFFVLDGLLTAFAAIALGIFFTTRQAKRRGLKVWDKTAQRLLLNLAIPLVTGGLFCLALLWHRHLAYVAPATLIFYGLALVQGSHFTLHDVKYLGFAEIFLGLVGMFMLRYGLELWAIGFGFLHIFYGLLMYVKYERRQV